MALPYLLDTNFFIEAHHRNYPPDVVLGFWTKVIALANAGKIISIDKVENEIHDHALKDWCTKSLPAGFFQSTTTIGTSYAKVSTWAASKLGKPYNSKAIADFLQINRADAWLIAYSIANGNLPIVTYEVSAPTVQGIIKIPDVCTAFTVSSMLPIQMFRRLKETF